MESYFLTMGHFVLLCRFVMRDGKEAEQAIGGVVL